MGYAQRLVERILADEKAKTLQARSQTIYRDEPLLFTGADLERFGKRTRQKKARRTAAQKPAPTPEKPLLCIDFSQLARIRDEAALSCEALLVDEEREDVGSSGTARIPPQIGSSCTAQIPPQTNAAPPPSQPDSAEPSSLLSDAAPPSMLSGGGEPSPLSPTETAYLRSVFDNRPASERAAIVRAADSSDAMMMDAINEKLFDLLCDIALADVNGEPELIEDYRDDVRGLIFA